MTWFDHDGRPTAVDLTHPVDLLEPEADEEPERGMSRAQFRDLVLHVARTFFTGDPKITVIAWRILDDDAWDSIRACARRAGCSAAAVSRRLKILREYFGLRPSAAHLRRLKRWEQRDRHLQTVRRGDSHPPAADEDQLEDNGSHSKKGGRL